MTVTASLVLLLPLLLLLFSAFSCRSVLMDTDLNRLLDATGNGDGEGGVVLDFFCRFSSCVFRNTERDSSSVSSTSVSGGGNREPIVARVMASDKIDFSRLFFLSLNEEANVVLLMLDTESDGRTNDDKDEDEEFPAFPAFPVHFGAPGCAVTSTQR